MVFIVRNANLPIHECRFSDSFSFGVADPVNRYCPFSHNSSTEYLTAFQIFGANCHSSINLGFFHCKIIDGFIFANSMVLFSSFMLPSCRVTKLFAICLHVVVFPHRLGHFTTIAQATSICIDSSSSIILFL
jgi:hypothetical protein